MPKAGSPDFATGSDWTPATGDVKVSIDGGSTANTTNLPTYTGGQWVFILTAAELTGKRIFVSIVDSATKAVDDNSFVVETFGNASAQFAADMAAGTVVGVAGVTFPANFSALSIDSGGVVKSNLAQILGTALTETAGLLAGGFKKFFNIASPTLTTAGTDQSGDNYPRIGAPVGASISADIATLTAALLPGTITGTVGASPAIGDFITNLTGGAIYAKMFCVMLTGSANAGLARPISTSSGSPTTLNFSDTWPILPVVGDTFVLVGYDG